MSPVSAQENRRERYYPAPPPPRVQHRSWMPSSVVIAGGGILAVMIAGEFGSVPLVATVALLATVCCGAILVAAQLTEEVRRARNRSRWSSAMEAPGRRSSVVASRRTP